MTQDPSGSQIAETEKDNIVSSASSDAKNEKAQEVSTSENSDRIPESKL